jgi:uncharacterized repeat protein (TIGR03803 family)
METASAAGHCFNWPLMQEADGAYKTLHTFLCNDLGGSSPNAAVILDAAGNLYGTTAYGGTHNDGTVFEMISGAGGTWTEKVLYSFSGPVRDGGFPFGSLVFDSSGSLYGSTLEGGGRLCGGIGCGIVFELVRHPGGVWQEKILHRFTGGQDGMIPNAGLVFDAAGALYGTTTHGGNCINACGTVFKLTPNAGGAWMETILYRFNHAHQDAESPYSTLVFDAAGNLYGTSPYGGQLDEGAVFRLTPQPDGGWKEDVIHDFGNDSASNPYAGLIVDSAGNLYGTTFSGGHPGLGTVFELTRQPDDTWVETLLYAFNFTDGGNPYAGVIFDSAGNLFGTTTFYGPFDGRTVFELRP